MDNNIRINCILCTHNCKPTFAHPYSRPTSPGKTTYHSFIYLLSEYLLRAYCVPTALLGAERQ